MTARRPFPRLVALPPLALLALLAGCGDAVERVASVREADFFAAEANVAADPAPAALSDRGRSAGQPPTDPAPNGDARPAGVKPKIIYTADLEVVVEDFAVAETALPKLADELGGYLASANVDRSSGRRLRGVWVVRIPVENYDAFLAGAGGLGVLEERDETARDVTAEFVDTESRLANRRKLEERLLELLAERPGELKDVLELERELARVRGEIETAEGRLRYLSNQTAYSTVTVRVREERNYVPPARPAFGARLADAFADGWEGVLSLARGTTLAAARATPFLVLFGLPAAFVLWLLVRRRRRTKSQS